VAQWYWHPKWDHLSGGKCSQPSRQRIYDLVDREGLDGKLVEKWIAAEETIYEDPRDPMVNWNRDDLAHAADQAGFSMKYFHPEQTAVEIFVSEAVLTRWFPEKAGIGKTQEKPSYAERLTVFLSQDEVDEIRRCITERLFGKQISWISESVHLVAHPK
jgi:putative ATPase